MDPFVRRLVERLFDPTRPLSRNRHFHTFDNPEGRRALRVHRRLLALQREIELCRQRGGTVQLVARPDDEEERVELRLEGPTGRRVATLDPGELDVLAGLPGMRQTLADARRA